MSDPPPLRFAEVSAGIVTNITLFAKADEAPPLWLPADQDVSIGWIHDGKGFHPPARDLEAEKAGLWLDVKQLRATYEDGGCNSFAGRVQTDAESRAKINGLVSLAIIASMTGAPFTVGFTLADNSVVPLNAQAAIALGATVGQFVVAVYARATALRNMIDASQSVQELDAIPISEGWPQ